MRWSFGGGLLTGWCIYTWTVWQYFFISERKFTTASETSTECTASTRCSTILVAMIGLGQSSAIATYCSNRMRLSHDENGSIQMNMYSLGVTDLDLSISTDVFGLRAFDNTKPVTRMLPGSSPCELRLMVPDDKLGKDGFHDVMIDNLSGTPTWRSSYVSPAEVTTLHRQWPKAVFETLRRRALDIERLRRDAPNRTDKAFRYSGPGYCGICDIRVYSALDEHLAEKHGGSTLEIKTNVAQCSPIGQ